jgi:ATP-binding cassette subfamily B protein
MPATDPCDILAQNSFLGALPEAELKGIGEDAAVVSAQLGDTIVEAGTQADGFYVVFSGRARVVAPAADGAPTTLATLEAGASFGEQSLLYDRPAGATVRAAGSLVLLKIAPDRFREIVRVHAAVRTRLEAHIEQYEEYNFLREMDMLAPLSEEEVRALAAKVERVTLSDGEVLFHEGDEGNAVYIVNEGRVRVVKESAGGTVLALVRTGGVIGEMALLYERPRSAGIVADGSTELLRLAKADFERVLSHETARELLLKQATNRVLQQRSLLDDADADDERDGSDDAAPQMHRRWEADPSGFWPRRRPVTEVDTPALAGAACLDAIDRYYRRDEDRRRQATERPSRTRNESLQRLSEDAEADDYLTRLVSIDEEQLAEASFPAVAETVDGRLRLVWAASRTSVLYADPVRRANESEGEAGPSPAASDGQEADPAGAPQGLQRASRDAFAQDWTGRLLTVSYMPNFSDVDWSLDEEGAVGRLFRRLAPMLRPYRALIGWIFAIALLTQLLGLAVPFVTQVIIDRVLVNGNQELLFILLAGLLAAAAFEAVSSGLNSLLRTYFLRQVGVSVMVRFLDHLLRLPNRISERWASGDFLRRFKENEKLVKLASQTGFSVIVSSLAALSYLVVMTVQHVALTGVALGFVAAYAGLMIWATPRLRANDNRVFAAQKEVESYLIETVDGVETVKGLAREGTFFQRGRALVQDALDAEYRGARLSVNVRIGGTLIQQGATVAVLGYGATLVLAGSLSAGQLVAFNAVLGLLLAPLRTLINSWDEVQEMRIAFERINDVLQLPTESRTKTGRLPDPLQGHVRFEDVSFWYDEEGEAVLSGINLEIPPGETVALVGRSGSGKTTLAKLLVRLLAPTEGRVRVDGVDLATVQGSALRRRVGIVEQDPFLFSGTIAENIGRADPEASLDRIVSAATLAGADAFINELPLGYRTPVGERGQTLSGGQRQRLVIARALLKNPAMLVLDEATSALDTETERTIQNNLTDITQDRTVVTIAHRLSTVRDADRIVVLDRGRIAETGTHDELMDAHGLYYYLHDEGRGDAVAVE